MDAVTTTATTHGAKLTELGAQIARVAHELNAPVSLIAGSLGNLDEHFDTLLHYVEATQPLTARDAELRAAYEQGRVDYAIAHARTLLAICDEGVRRVNYVVEQLRTYTRRAALAAAEPIELAEILQRAARLAREGRANAPQVAWDLASLPALHGDPQALGQAFANLFANAYDAVAETAAPCIAARTLRRGDTAVEVRVRDNGPGIPVEQRGSVFQPFVSSKPSGVGLGLAIVREAIERHGGTVALRTPAGGGAEFVVTLPLAGAAESGRPKAESSLEP